MRYDELDLTQLLPDGQPLNEENHVENRGYINAFFLRAFEWWYREFAHYAKSYAAPYSLDACMACTQSELQRFIEEAGCIFYNGNSIETNATFTNSLYTIPLGTDGIINAITQYIFNSRAVTGTVDYTGLQAHHYRIIAEGELESGEITPEVMARFDAILNNFVPVTEKIDGFTLREAVELTANLTDIAVNPLRCCEIELEIPEPTEFAFAGVMTSTADTQVTFIDLPFGTLSAD